MDWFQKLEIGFFSCFSKIIVSLFGKNDNYNFHRLQTSDVFIAVFRLCILVDYNVVLKLKTKQHKLKKNYTRRNTQLSWVGGYMAIYGDIYGHIYDHIWPYIWPYVWPDMAIYIYGHTYGHIWPYMVIYGHIYGHIYAHI